MLGTLLPETPKSAGPKLQNTDASTNGSRRNGLAEGGVCNETSWRMVPIVWEMNEAWDWDLVLLLVWGEVMVMAGETTVERIF